MSLLLITEGFTTLGLTCLLLTGAGLMTGSSVSVMTGSTLTFAGAFGITSVIVFTTGLDTSTTGIGVGVKTEVEAGTAELVAAG